METYPAPQSWYFNSMALALEISEFSRSEEDLKNFNVCDKVTPANVEDGMEITLMKALEGRM